MFQTLTDNEKKSLDFYKQEYDKKQSNSLGYIQPKLKIKIVEDTLVSLQSKGYLEVSRTDFGNNEEFINVLLKDKFFKYFNININQ